MALGQSTPQTQSEYNAAIAAAGSVEIGSQPAPPPPVVQGVASAQGFIFRLMPNGDLQQNVNGSWTTRDTNVTAARFRPDGGGYDRLTYVGPWALDNDGVYRAPRHMVSLDGFASIQSGSSNDWYLDALQNPNSIDIPMGV